ncbi:MAG TPA: SDR family oxidoreductase [Thermoleophilaceae bacterium]
MGPKTILLTGATGVVGAALLQKLGGQRVVCLAHNDAPAPNGGDVEVVRGSVTEPLLGLDRKKYDEIARRVDAVVNCAAITEYTATRKDMFAVNVDGVGRALELADRGGADFFHLGTAFVATTPIEVDESRGSRDVKRWWNPQLYIESKRAADDVVANSGVPAAVLRPSIVFGDSETGETAKFQGVHVLIRVFFEESLPLVPLDPDRRIDFIPRDVLADLIVDVLDRPFVAREWWLTAGESALTVDDLMRVGAAYLERIGSDIAPPRVVAPSMVDRLIRPVFLPQLPARMRRRFEQLMQLEPLFFTDEVFGSSIPEIERTSGIAVDLKLEQAYTAAVDFWRDRKAARSREHGGDEVAV